MDQKPARSKPNQKIVIERRGDISDKILSQEIQNKAIAMTMASPVAIKLREATRGLTNIERIGHANHLLSVIGYWHSAIMVPFEYFESIFEKHVSQTKKYDIVNRLHLSHGIPSINKIYMIDFAMGSIVELRLIYSLATGFPEIQAVYPLIDFKTRRYYVIPKKIKPAQNYLEAIIDFDVFSPAAEECLDTVGKLKAEEAAQELYRTKNHSSFQLRSFDLDYPERPDLHKVKSLSEVFIIGIAAWLVRNPRTASDKFLSPSTDEQCQIPYHYAESYKSVRGIVQRRDSDPSDTDGTTYVQGVCVAQKNLNPSYNNRIPKSYLVTLRLDEHYAIDVDFFVLGRHLIAGDTELKPGNTPNIAPGSENAIPQVGDLVFGKVWFQNSIHGYSSKLPHTKVTSETIAQQEQAKTIKSEEELANAAKTPDPRVTPVAEQHPPRTTDAPTITRKFV